MDSLNAAQRERTNYNQKIIKESVKKISTNSIKQYLFEKEIKKGTMDYYMLVELNQRGEDISKYKIIK